MHNCKFEKIKVLASLTLFVGGILLSTYTCAVPFSERPEVQTFIANMSTKHNLDADKLTQAFAKYESSPEILEKISKPYEEKPWHTYRELFITEKRIKDGAKFWKKYETELTKAQKEFGVPAEIIVAIIGVETLYGENTGKYPVLQALATIAFDYPKRSAFFTQELEQFLLLCEEEKFSLTDMKGSYAGAMGAPQFISSSYRNHAIDFANIGKRDIITNMPNAIGSVANYLKIYGWVPNQGVAVKAKVVGKKYRELQPADKKNPKPALTLAKAKQYGISPVTKVSMPTTTKVAFLELEQPKNKEFWLGRDNFYSITRYNHSSHYAMAVYQLSQEISKAMRGESIKATTKATTGKNGKISNKKSTSSKNEKHSA